jgi:hypothetical protein
MITTNADGRPRIFITANHDRKTAMWRHHPAARPIFAASPGAALDAALAELDGAAVVAIFEPGPPP